MMLKAFKYAGCRHFVSCLLLVLSPVWPVRPVQAGPNDWPDILSQPYFYERPVKAANGDWVTNAGPVLGKATEHRAAAGALWQVITPKGLNCRAQAQPNATIVKRFVAGQLLQANLYAGGSDEVLLNGKDQQGRYWMAVRTPAGQTLDCYVRAHRRLIQPVRKHGAG